MQNTLVKGIYFILFWLCLSAAIVSSALLLDLILFFNQELPVWNKTPGIITAAISGILLFISTHQQIIYTDNTQFSPFLTNNFLQKGIFNLWRHPVFLFFNLFIGGLALLMQSISMVSLLFPVTLISTIVLILRKEKNLKKQFGKHYQNYQKRVPILIPHFYFLILIVAKLLAKILFNLKVYSSERIPNSSPYFVVASHRSYLDTFIIGTAIFNRVRFVDSHELTTNRFLKFLFKTAKVIPHRRYLKDLSATKEIMRALNQGYPVGIFPEGDISWTGKGLKVKPEILKLFKKYFHIPILPVIIEGDYHAWPRWSDKFLSATVKVSFDNPIYLQAYHTLDEIEKIIVSRIKPMDLAWKTCHTKAPIRTHGITQLLYRCPLCMYYNSLYETNSNNIECNICSTSYFLKSDLSLEYTIGAENFKASIHELYSKIKIKNNDLVNFLSLKIPEYSLKSKDDEKRLIYHANCSIWRLKNKKFQLAFIGLCSLSEKFLSITSESTVLIIKVTHISSLTIQGNKKLLVYDDYRKQLFQLIYSDDSALKWLDLIQLLVWQKQGRTHDRFID